MFHKLDELAVMHSEGNPPLDIDGNAMTRSEGDVESLVVGPLSSGAVDVTLSLIDQPTIAE